MQLVKRTVMLVLAWLLLSPANATNMYQNSSFELGLSPVLSGGESRLVEGITPFGKRYASSGLEYIMFNAVPVPPGVSEVTISAYARSATVGRVKFGLQGSLLPNWLWATQTTLSPQWIRYTATFPVSGDTPAFISPFLWNRDLTAVDLDGVQIEFTGLSDYAALPVVDTGVWTAQYGNVYDATTSVDVKIGVANQTGTQLAAQWVVSVMNHKGESVYADTRVVTLAAGAAQERTVVLGTLDFGHYTVVSSVYNGSAILAQKYTTFAVVAGRADDPNADRFGFHIKYVNETGDPDISEKRWGLLHRLGGGWVRIWCSWRDVENVKGTYDWSYYDKEIAIAKSKGTRILGVLYNRNPSWAGPDDLDTLDLSADASGRLAFIRAFVERYKDAIDAWEIFNEPYWFYAAHRALGTSAKFITDYAVLHRATYTIIKALDPTAPAISMIGESYFRSDYDWAFFLGIAQAGLLDYTDGISMHEYHYNTPVTALRSQYETGLAQVRQVLSDHGKPNLPIWQTETAIKTDDRLDATIEWYERLTHFLKEYLPSEWLGAKQYAKAIILRRRAGVAKEFYFNLSQVGPTEPILASFRNRWEEPKVIFPVQAALARTLADTDYNSEDSCLADGAQLYFFKDAARVVAAYWTDGTETTLNVKSPALVSLSLVDLMGNSKSLAASASVVLPLGSEPRFIVASSDDTGKLLADIHDMICQRLPRPQNLQLKRLP